MYIMGSRIGRTESATHRNAAKCKYVHSALQRFGFLVIILWRCVLGRSRVLLAQCQYILKRWLETVLSVFVLFDFDDCGFEEEVLSGSRWFN